MSEIKNTIVALSNKLEEGMTLDASGAIISDKDLFEKSLPEGMTMDQVKQVHGHTEDLVAAMTLATGNIGEKAMAKDKKLDMVTSQLKMGRFGEINVGYNRSVERTVRNIQDPSQPPKDVTIYGSATPRVKFGAQKNKGELKKVRTSLQERAENLFK